MSPIIKSVLSRLLAEEVQNQLIWEAEDKKHNIECSRRQEVITAIKQFAEDNNIDLF